MRNLFQIAQSPCLFLIIVICSIAARTTIGFSLVVPSTSASSSSSSSSAAAAAAAIRTPKSHRIPVSSLRSAASEGHISDDAPEEHEEDSSALKFEDLGLLPETLKAVYSHKDWTEPTPIQQLAIPRLLAKQQQEENEHHNLDSIWCQSPTGSGKTAAFVLPLLQRLLMDRRQRHSQQQLQQQSTSEQVEPAIASLILCPTRELAAQIGTVVTELASQIAHFNVLVLTGGTRREDQLSLLADWARQGESADVVIATPGRLVDVLTRYQTEDDAKDAALERRLLQAMETTDDLTLDQIQKLQLFRDDDEGRTQLSRLLEGLQYLVLDEADRLLGKAFETDMNAVLDLLKPDHRHNQVVETWLFSATFPKQIEPRVDTVLQRLGHSSTVRISCANSDRLNEDEGDEISATLQKRLERIQQHESAPKKTSLAAIGTASTIQLRTIRLEKRDRTQALKYLIQQHEAEWSHGGVLVFVATRYASEHVSRKLRRAGIQSAEVHGKLDSHARARRLQDLESGKIHVLVTTDLTSRGIDIKDLSAVINYDLPRSTSDFVHRAGRTGRAGKSGTAITFVTPTTESHMDLIERRHLPEPTPREVLPGFEVDEDAWNIQSESARIRAPGAGSSEKSLAFDRMHGGIKGKRKSKKDRLREKAAQETSQTKVQ